MYVFRRPPHRPPTQLQRWIHTKQPPYEKTGTAILGHVFDSPDFRTTSSAEDVTGASGSISLTNNKAGSLMIALTAQMGTGSNGYHTLGSYTNLVTPSGATGMSRFLRETHNGRTYEVWVGFTTTAGTAGFTLSTAGGEDSAMNLMEVVGAATGTTFSDIFEEGATGDYSLETGTSSVPSAVDIQTLDANRFAAMFSFVDMTGSPVFNADIVGESGGTWTNDFGSFHGFLTDGSFFGHRAPMASAGTISGGDWNSFGPAPDAWTAVGFAIKPSGFGASGAKAVTYNKTGAGVSGRNPFSTALDTFNRANTTTLGTGNWTKVSGPGTGLDIANGRVILGSTDSPGTYQYYWNASDFGPDCEVSLHVVDAVDGFSFDNIIELTLRSNTALTTGYRVAFTLAPTNTFTVTRLSGGTVISATALTISDGDRIGFRALGNQLSVWRRSAAGNWALIASATDATHTGSGKVGFGLASDTLESQIDDFSAQDTAVDPGFTTSGAKAVTLSKTGTALMARESGAPRNATNVTSSFLSDTIRARQVTDSGGRVSGLYAYVKNQEFTARSIRAVVYTDSGGVPDVLLGQGVDTSVQPSGATGEWRWFPFSSPVAVPSGTYWIGVQGQATSDAMHLFVESTTGGTGYTTTDTFSGGAAATWPGGGSSTAHQYKIIAVEGLTASGTAEKSSELYPHIASIQTGTQASDATTWTLTYPSGVQAGDLILAFLAIDGSVTISSHPFDVAGNMHAAPSSAACVAHLKKKATGSESGTFNIDISSAEQGSWAVMRITNWSPTIGQNFNNSTDGGMVTVGGFDTGTGTAVAMGGHDPAYDHGTNNTSRSLWLTIGAADGGDTTFTAMPTNYTQVVALESGGAGGASLGIGYRKADITNAEFPDDFTIDASEEWGAFIMSVASKGIKSGTATSHFNCDVHPFRTPILDDFNRANEDPVATNWSGPINNGEGQLKIVGNVLTRGSLAWGGSYYDLAQYGPDSVEAHVSVSTTFTTNERFAVWINTSSFGAGDNDGYAALWYQSGNIELYRLDDDVGTLLGTAGAVGVPTAGDALGLRAVGGTVQIWAKQSGTWGLKLTRSDQVYKSGYLGVEIIGNTAAVDNFGGGVPINHGAKAVIYAKTGSATVGRILGAPRANTLEGGSDETDISTGNSGAASGDAFDVVTVGTANEVKFDTAQAMHGKVSARFLLNTTAANVFLEWTQATLTTTYGRFYFRIEDALTAAIRLVRLRAGGNQGFVELTAGSKIRILDESGTNVAAMAGTVSPDTWYRVEYRFTQAGASGSAEVHIYAGDSTTALETLGPVTATVGSTDYTTAQHGNAGGLFQSTARTLWMDGIVAGATTWPGPEPSGMAASGVSEKTVGGGATYEKAGIAISAFVASGADAITLAETGAAAIGLQIGTHFLSETTGQGLGSSSSFEALGQSFTPTANMSSFAVTIKASRDIIHQPVDQLRIGVQTNNAGEPSGTWVGFQDFTVTNTTYQSFTAYVNAPLTGGTLYHLVVTRTGAMHADQNYALVARGNAFAGFGLYRYRSSGVWQAENGSNRQIQFLIDGNGMVASGADVPTWSKVGMGIQGGWTHHVHPTVNTIFNRIRFFPGDGLYIAVCDDEPELLTSPDGITWTSQATGIGAGRWLNDVAYSASQDEYIAVGEDGRCATSTNGTSWSSLGDITGASESVRGIAWGESAGVWVAIGVSNVYTSPDGTTWSNEGSPFSGGATGGLAVEWSDDEAQFVATSGGGHISTSPDGETWTPRTPPESGKFLHKIWRSESLDMWVVSSNDFQEGFYWSNDGVTWNSEVTPFDSSDDVVYAEEEGLWMASGFDGIFVTADNGATWTEFPPFYTTLNPVTKVRTKSVDAISYSPRDRMWIAGAVRSSLSTSFLGTYPSRNAFGADAVTYSETGSGVSERKASGADSLTAAETGVAKSRHQTYPNTITTPILDSGVGADENPLVTNWTGPIFTGNADMRRVSNQFAPTQGGGDSNAYYDLATFGPDAEVYITLASWPSVADTLTLYARTKDQPTALDAYALRVIGVSGASNDIFRLGQYTDSNAFSQLGSDFVQEFFDGYGVGLRVIGDALYAYYRSTSNGPWTLLGSVSDSRYAGVIGHLAMQVQSDGSLGMRLTNFGGGTIVVSHAGANAVTYSETGAGVSERKASGADAVTSTETGTATSEFTGTADGRWEVNRAGPYVGSPVVRTNTTGGLGNPTIPASVRVGDLLVWAASHVAGAVTASGYTDVPNGPVGTLRVAYRIATGSDAISMSDGNARAYVVAFRAGTFNTVDPFGGSAADTTAVTGNPVIGELPAATVESAGSLILWTHQNVRDGENTSTFWGSWVTPNGETFTELADFMSSSGLGSGLAAGYFIRAQPGSMVVGTVTMGNTGAGGGHTLEIQPPDHMGHAGGGADATTYAETGAGVSARVASGTKSLTGTKTGAGVAPFTASGADAPTYAETGIGIAPFVASGASQHISGNTYEKSGIAVSGSITEGAAGLAPIGVMMLGSPFMGGGAGGSANGFVASGVAVVTSGVEYIKVGAAVAEFTASGADVFTSAETGAAIAPFTSSGARTKEASRVGAGIASFVATGVDAFTATEAGTAITVFGRVANYPVIKTADSKSGGASGPGTTITLDYPDNLVAGDLIVAFAGIFASRDPVPPAGGWQWREHFSGSSFGGVTEVIGKKVSDGTESGTTFAITYPTGDSHWWWTYRITGWGGTLGSSFDTSTGDVVVAVAAGNGSTPDPPLLDPPWGIEDTIWFAFSINEGNPNYSVFPLPDNQAQQGDSGGQVAISSDELTQDSLNPGTFTIGSGQNWRTATVAVRPTLADSIGADAVTFVESGTAVSERVASGADAATFSETGTAIAPFTASGTVTKTAAREGTAVSEFTASGADAVTSAEAGTGIVNFVASGASVYVSGVEYVKAGAAVTEFTASGADAFTASEAGAGIAPFTASGTKVKEATRTGTGTAPFTASGADVVTSTETGTGVSIFVGSGADAVTSTEAGIGIAPFTASGDQTGDVLKSGTAIAGFTASGVDAFTASETGAGIAAFTATGADTATWTKAGTAISAFVASGTRARELPRTGAGISGYTSSGADACTFSDTGQCTSGFTASGADAVTSSETGAGVAPFTASGADSATSSEAGAGVIDSFIASGDASNTFTKAGAGVSEFAASGTNLETYAETGTGISPFTASGADVATFTETGAGIAPFTASGTKVREVYKSGTATAIFTASGVNEKSVSRTATGIAPFTASGYKDSGVTATKAGTTVAEFTAYGEDAVTSTEAGTTISVFTGSGADAVTSTEVGTGISPFVTSGDANITFSKTGAGITEFKASGTDEATANRANTAISIFTASGADVFTSSETGAGIAPFVASGDATDTQSNAGTAIAEFAASGADAVTYSETGAGVSAFTASGADVVTSSEAGTGITEFATSGTSVEDQTQAGAAESEFSGAGDSAIVYAETGAGVTEFTGTGSSNNAKVKAGFAVAPFVASGIADEVYTEAGAGIAPFTASGVDEHTATETGAAVAPFTVSGDATDTQSNTGSAVSEFIGSGADAVTYTEAGTTVSAFSATGADEATHAEAGTGIAPFTTSGDAASTITRAGTAVSEFTCSGTRSRESLRANTAIAPFTASGADEATFTETQTAIAPFTSSGADEFTATESGAGIINFVAYGSRDKVNDGTGVSEFTADGTSSVTYSETGTATSTFTASGTRAVDHLRTGQGTAIFTASGTEIRESLKAATGIAVFTATGADACTFSDTGTGITEFTCSGARIRERLVAGTTISEFVASGADAITITDTGSATAPFTGSGADVFTASDTGAGIAPFTGTADGQTVFQDSGTGVAPFTAAGSNEDVVLKAGTAIAPFTASGGRTKTYTSAGSATSEFVASGTQALVYGEAGTGVAPFSGSGAKANDVARTGAGVLALYAFGADEATWSRAETAIAPFTVSGGQVAQFVSVKTGTAIMGHYAFGPRGHTGPVGPASAWIEEVRPLSNLVRVETHCDIERDTEGTFIVTGIGDRWG